MVNSTIVLFQLSRVYDILNMKGRNVITIADKIFRLTEVLETERSNLTPDTIEILQKIINELSSLEQTLIKIEEIEAKLTSLSTLALE